MFGTLEHESVANDPLGFAAVVADLHARLQAPFSRQQPDAIVLAATIDEAEALQQCLDDYEVLDVAMRAQGSSLHSSFSQLALSTTVLQRLSRGLNLSLEELFELSTLVRAAVHVSNAWHDTLRRTDTPRHVADGPLASTCAALVGFGGLHEMCTRVLEPGSPPTIREDASPTLVKLRVHVREAQERRRERADKLLLQPGVRALLSDGFVTERDGRMVVPVRSDSGAHQHGPLRGMVHDSSGSGRTLFVEPFALSDENNRVRATEAAVRREEAAILRALSETFADHASQITQAGYALVELDRLHARLRQAEALQAVRPSLTSSASRMLLPAARHPAMVLAGKNAVANDLELAVGGALVLSGPNAGGKTVAMRTFGLLAMMAAAGLRLPTRAPAEVPLFTHILADIGDAQTVLGDLSTFTAHLQTIRSCLEVAREHGPRALILLDEVAAGTEPEQGAALAAAILEEIVACGASCVVTTHFDVLKHEASARPTWRNASFACDPQTMQPRFTIHYDLPGRSAALAAAVRMGLPSHVVECAQSRLHEASSHVETLLAKLHEQEHNLEERSHALTMREHRLTKKEHELVEKITAFRDKREVAIEAARQGVLEDLRALRLRMREKTKAPPSHDARPSSETVKQLHEEAASLVARAERPKHEPESPVVFCIGDRVRVPSLGLEGTILAVRGDSITVDGPMRTTVRRDAIVVTQSKPAARARYSMPEPPAQNPHLSHAGSAPKPFEPLPSSVIDVRGLRADEALRQVEAMLDRAMSEDVSTVLIRHGIGTGALRAAVREALQYLPHAEGFRPGLDEEGGEGVTVVALR